jgi:hypothetical protein
LLTEQLAQRQQFGIPAELWEYFYSSVHRISMYLVAKLTVYVKR